MDQQQYQAMVYKHVLEKKVNYLDFQKTRPGTKETVQIKMCEFNSLLIQIRCNRRNVIQWFDSVAGFRSKLEYIIHKTISG